jgi:hypothetical protein
VQDNLILPVKPKEKIYKSYHTFEKYYHTDVGLPPYLNATEPARAKTVSTLRENFTGDLGPQNVQVTNDAMALLTKEVREGFCEHMEIVEN